MFACGASKKFQIFLRKSFGLGYYCKNNKFIDYFKYVYQIIQYKSMQVCCRCINKSMSNIKHHENMMLIRTNYFVQIKSASCHFSFSYPTSCFSSSVANEHLTVEIQGIQRRGKASCKMIYLFKKKTTNKQKTDFNRATGYVKLQTWYPYQQHHQNY